MVGKIVGWPQRYYLDGLLVTKEEFDAAFPPQDLAGPPGGHATLWGRGLKSDALAVHPSQIPEVMARNKRHGLSIEYNESDGRPILKDRGQRRDLLKIEGVHDNDGGYGDDHA